MVDVKNDRGRMRAAVNARKRVPLENIEPDAL
jgi:hypothetical protein